MTTTKVRPKVVTVTLRMSPEEHALLQQAANIDKRSINAYVLHASVRQAQATLRAWLKKEVPA